MNENIYDIETREDEWEFLNELNKLNTNKN